MGWRDREELREAQQEVPAIKADTDRKKEVLANMFYAGCSLIGGLENTMSDYAEDDPDYIHAEKCLADHAGLVDEVRAWCMSGFYGCGIEGPKQPYQQHYNLVGNAFIDQCAEEVVKALGH